MRKVLALVAGLLMSGPALADGLQFPDPAEDAQALKLCASDSEVPLADRLKCGEAIFDVCRFEAAAKAPDEPWRVVFGHCIERVARAWDDLVKDTYGTVSAGAKKRGVHKALRDAQRKWMAWRDAKCIWKDPILHGNDAEFGEVECLRRTNALRAIDLLDDLRYFQ